MFICKKCGREDVPRRGKRSSCKECESKYLKEWKENRPEKQTQYNKASNSTERVKAIKRENVQDRQQRRRRIKELCVEYLGGSCQYEPVCPYPLLEGHDQCFAAFDFHHVDPKTKTAGIAQIINTKLRDTVIRKIQILSDVKKHAPELIAELDKCMLLCSNCHSRIEYCCKRKMQVDESEQFESLLFES